MKNISLDSILLFALVIPFVMTFRIGPGDTPYWLFSTIFLSLLVYIVLDLLKIKENIYFKCKQLTLFLIILEVIGSAFFASIIVRHQTVPWYGAHDIILQQESAIRFLIHGKNPYQETYFGTPLEKWHYSDTEVNPALYHFVMQPFYLISAIPFYFASNKLFGFFDGRMPLLFFFFVLLYFAHKLIRDKSQKLQFLILLAFNPAMLGYTLEGRSDIYMFTFMFIGLFLLYKNKFSLAGVPMALAFTIKQSIWPFLPFYVFFIYFKTRNITKVLKDLLPFIITSSTIVLPFLIWNYKAFLDSTVFYLSGNTQYSYPISGYGLGKLLNQIGIIGNIKSYYPFHIWQAFIGLPAMIILIIYLKRKPEIKRLIIVYGIFLFVYWYLSRYFNNSHLGFLSIVFLTAYFWPEDSNIVKDIKK